MLSAIVRAAGPVLDVSSPGEKTLSIDSTLPSLHLVLNLKDITINLFHDRIGETKQMVIHGPLTLVLTMLN